MRMALQVSVFPSDMGSTGCSSSRYVTNLVLSSSHGKVVVLVALHDCLYPAERGFTTHSKKCFQTVAVEHTVWGSRIAGFQGDMVCMLQV